MGVLLITACVFTLSIQNVFVKQYNLKCTSAKYTFSCIRILFALLFFLVTTRNISFSIPILPYSISFSAAYITSLVAAFLAIRNGSFAITSLLISYSLIIPTLYGFIFLNEELKVAKLIGIALLLISLFLVRGESEKDKPEKGVSFKWIVYVSFAFLGNGLCSTIQNMQQRKFSGEQNGNFMILSLIISFIVLAILSFIKERKLYKTVFKYGTFYGAAAGISNGITNYIVMIAVGIIATSVFFPIISAGGLIIASVLSVMVYKEKLIKRQIIGIAFGIASLVFLNI